MNEMYKTICEKLGFEPKDYEKHKKPYKPGVIDDSPSVWSVLTLEELDFIIDNDLLNKSIA